MKRHFLALALIGLPTLASAQGSRAVPGLDHITSAKPEASEFAKLVVPGKAVASGVRKLRKELDWYQSLRDAGRAARRQNKLVLVIQALGKLDGYT